MGMGKVKMKMPPRAHKPPLKEYKVESWFIEQDTILWGQIELGDKFSSSFNVIVWQRQVFYNIVIPNKVIFNLLGFESLLKLSFI